MQGNLFSSYPQLIAQITKIHVQDTKLMNFK